MNIRTLKKITDKYSFLSDHGPESFGQQERKIQRHLEKVSKMSEFPESDKENFSSAAPPTTTPSKQRYSLGSASAYYFKYMNSSAKKKNDTSILDDEDITGTISIPGIQIDKSSVNPFLASVADTSVLSIGASSSSSEESDLLNKSTLSDTTELTASNFVLAATSRQKIRRFNTPSNRKRSPTQQARPFDSLQNVNPQEKVPALKEAQKSEGIRAESLAMHPPRGEANNSGMQEGKPEAERLDPKSSPDQGRQSFKGASPSLRSRISASPSSLRKFTESLKSSRIKRQMQREEDAKRRLSSDSLVFAMNDRLDSAEMDTFSRQRLPPPLAQPSPLTMPSPMDSSSPSFCNVTGTATQEIMGTLGEIFGGLRQDTEELDTLAENTNRSSITARKSSIGRLFGDSTAVNSATQQTPELSTTDKKGASSESKENVSFESPSSPTTEPSMLKLTSGSLKIPTPTKLAPTPQKIPNPRLLDSPARYTRSARKASSNVEDVGTSAMRRRKSEGNTAAISDLSEILGMASQSVESPSSPKSPEDAVMHEPSPSQRDVQTEAEGGDTASIGDISGILGGQPTSSTPTPSSEKEARDITEASSPGSSPRRIPNPRLLDSPARYTRSARKASSNVEDVGTSAMRRRKSEGNTAAVSDLSEILGMASQLVESPSSPKSPEDAVMHEPFPSQQDVQTETEGGDTASIGDISGILGGQPTSSTSTPSFGREARDIFEAQDYSPMDDSHFEDDTGLLVGLDNIHGAANSAEVEPSQKTSHPTPKSTPQDFLSQSSFGSAARTPVGAVSDRNDGLYTPDKTSGSTASIGDLAEVFGSLSQETSLATSVSNSHQKSGMTQRYLGSAERTPTGTDISMLSSRSEENGDTASIGDIAELLGTQSSTEGEGSRDTYSKTSEYSLSQSPVGLAQDNEAGTKVAVESIGNGEDTASIGEISGILGTQGSTQIRDSLEENSLASPASMPCESTVESRPSRGSITKPSRVGDTLGINNPAEAGSPKTGVPSQSPLDKTPTPSTQEGALSLKSPMRLTPGSRPRPTPTNIGKSPRRIPISKSPMRLTPGSRPRPTPTKIAPSPRRISNPMLPTSPARNTRSAKNAGMEVVADSSMEISIDVEQESHTQKRQLSQASADSSSPRENGDGFSQVGVLSSKRRRSTIPKPARLKNDKENFSPKSPLSKKRHLTGILSSNKRNRSFGGSKFSQRSQRSVAFGSPEAAEYHVGSPSVSLTPMPQSKARELFSIPREKPTGEALGLSGTSSESIGNAEETVEIEADLNVLVDKITVENMKESPSLSPIANVDEREDTRTFMSVQGCDLQTAEHSNASPNFEAMSEASDLRDEVTVELEGGIDGLLANAMNPPEKLALSKSGEAPDNPRPNQLGLSETDRTDKFEESKSVNSEKSPSHPSEITLKENDDDYSFGAKTEGSSADNSPAESIEMADAQSIFSMNSRAEKFTAEFSIDAQKLDFSFDPAEVSKQSSASMDIVEGHTIELENDMTSLLAAAGVEDSLRGIESKVSQQSSSLQDEESLICDPSDRVEKDDRDLQRASGYKSPQEISKDCPPGLMASPKLLEKEENTNGFSSSRRKSIASRRFTLSPHTKSRFSDDIALNNEQSPQVQPRSWNDAEESVCSPDEVYMKDSDEPVTLTFHEVVNGAGVLPEELGLSLGSKVADTLVRFNESSDSADKITCEKWNQFLEAVCGEVERRTEVDGAAAEAFSSLVDPQPTRLVDLQNRLRSSDKNINQDLRRLVENGKVSIEAEWNTWLATVMESFQNPLLDIAKHLNDDIENVDRVSEQCKNFQDKLLLINKRKLHRARRKSFSRRKVSERPQCLIQAICFSSHQMLSNSVLLPLLKTT